MDFDIGEILTHASQITWDHKVLWIFNMFPILFIFLLVPVVFIPRFFVDPFLLARQGAIDQAYQGLGLIWLRPLLTFLFLIPFLFLFLIIQSPQAGMDVQRFGRSLVELCLLLLSILALARGVAITFINPAFMILYLCLTRSAVLQTALQ